ncbi:MAG: hypothetical protein WCF33_09900 [Pseudonocardiaceae bacterium]
MRIDEGRPADCDALRRSLGEVPAELWTGTAVTDQEKKIGLGDLDYWLATQYDLCRLLTRSPDHGLVAPVYGWGSMAVRDQGTFAYLTKRPAGETGESELGVCAYGPDSEELASRAVERIRSWDTGRKLATQIEVYPYGAQAPDSGTLLVADKRHIRVIVRVMPLAARSAGRAAA